MADSHSMEHGHAHGHAHAHDYSWDNADQHGTHFRKYVIIGAILTAITGVEVAVFYIPALAGVLVPVLLVLSLIKFVMVVLYYMHLKEDDAVFGRVFWAPLALAVLVVVGMIILFKVLPKYGVFS
jgi:cytochrome c oxidase subunit 4